MSRPNAKSTAVDWKHQPPTFSVNVPARKADSPTEVSDGQYHGLLRPVSGDQPLLKTKKTGLPEIIDHDVSREGELRFLVKRGANMGREWVTQEQGGIPQDVIDEWMHNRLDNNADYDNRFGNTIAMDRIIGHDHKNALIAWKRHPFSNAELKPVWIKVEDIDESLANKWEAEMAALVKEGEQYRLEHGEDGDDCALDVAVLQSGNFSGMIKRPFSKLVRDAIEEKYPRAFDLENYFERNASVENVAKGGNKEPVMMSPVPREASH